MSGFCGLMQGTTATVIDLQPYPLTPIFFAERMRGVDEETSADMFQRLQGIKVLDDSGFCVWHKCENCWCALSAPHDVDASCALLRD